MPCPLRILLLAAQEVKDSGIRVDVALLSALIAALGSEGLAEEALTVFRKMVCAHPTILHTWTCIGHNSCVN